MNTEPPEHATAAPALAHSPTPYTARRLDRIDAPARPLGPKRAALRARRSIGADSTRRGRTAEGNTKEVVLASDNATVAFLVRITDFGVLIERMQHAAVGARLTQTMSFRDGAAFDRWCGAEPVRFEDPMLYVQLRRRGHEALAARR